ncbi:MAG: T9SS type A sorting domain-containing protein [Saprospiraceae bacterium]
MLKQLSFVFLLMTLLGAQKSEAQLSPFTATIDCINYPNRIVAVNMPPVNSATRLWTGTFVFENPCRRVFWSANGCGNGANQPQYYLERYDFATGTWNNFAGPQKCPTFSNLPHGTWRVIGQNPIESNGSGCEGGHILVYNVLEQWIGYLGTYINAPKVVSNVVVTEPTLQNEIAATYIETYGTLDNALFNYDETPKINTTGTINYDRWWIAIFERGGQNRYGGLGWTFGFIPNNEINLQTVWSQVTNGGSFAPITSGVTYDVQFAIMGQCNSEWVESGISNFGVCPEGLLCKGVFEESDISLAPNPANSSFHLSGIDMNDPGSNYHLKLLDLSGRVVKEFTQVSSDELDVSDIPNGLYAVSLLDGERQVKTFKLSIVH